jgi:hypothetical protein
MCSCCESPLFIVRRRYVLTALSLRHSVFGVPCSIFAFEVCSGVRVFMCSCCESLFLVRCGYVLAARSLRHSVFGVPCSIFAFEPCSCVVFIAC